VHGDVRELSRALSNLVVNAIRHTPADGTVRIEASEVPAAADPGSAEAPGGMKVRISVTDACGGIPEEDLDRVFDVAWRGTPARTPEAADPVGAGAGLGLAIVRGIAEAHAGDVTVGNVAGGCRFEMLLPTPVG
jgi:signal transduction histidine kinase